MASNQRSTAKKPASVATAAEPEQTFAPMRGEPGTAYGFTLADGTAREIKSDARGVVHPKRAEDVNVLRSMGLDFVKESASASGTTVRKINPPDEIIPVVPPMPVTTTEPAEQSAEKEA